MKYFCTSLEKNVPALLTLQGPFPRVSPCSLPHDPAGKGSLFACQDPCSSLRLEPLSIIVVCSEGSTKDRDVFNNVILKLINKL